jgi:hypothetical protein
MAAFGATSPFARAPAKDRSPPVCDSLLISAERLKPTLNGHSPFALLDHLVGLRED